MLTVMVRFALYWFDFLVCSICFRFVVRILAAAIVDVGFRFGWRFCDLFAVWIWWVCWFVGLFWVVVESLMVC